MANRVVKPPKRIQYPMSDGKPTADNTLQFDWIVRIVDGLAVQYKDADDVFIASNLIWYPVQGKPKVRTAPDVMVSFGRPKGFRPSYLQWKEAGIAPQVVFDIYSPRNRPPQLKRLFNFYQRHGVEEYYFIDPYKVELKAWRREAGKLKRFKNVLGTRSPRLGVLLEIVEGDLRITDPGGREFLDPRNRARLDERAQEQLRQEAEQQRQQRDEERARYNALIERMRAEGINPTRFLGDS